MRNVPDERVMQSLPFQNTGIDYADSFLMKSRKGCGCKNLKCYICLFIGFITRAIHIKLFTDLTTECFLLCFNILISRRGIPTKVYSDNGSTFKGASNE